MYAKTKVAGTWKDISAPYVKVSGVWKMAKAAYIKVSGSWKNWFLQGGLIDAQFLSAIGTGLSNYSVVALAVQPDGKLILGGNFGNLSNFNGTTMYRILRLNADYTIDTSFYTGIGTGFGSSGNAGTIQTIQVLSNGKILVAGEFERFNGTYDGNIYFGGTEVSGLALLNSNGTLDTSFYANTGAAFYNLGAYSSAVQSDGKILLVGYFTAYNDLATNRIVRLNANGTRDTDFMTNVGAAFNNTIYSVALQQDGKIIVGGMFSSFKGTTINKIARLNADGTLDATFASNIGTGVSGFAVADVAVQPDGKILAVGDISSFNGATVRDVIRLNSDGTRDTAFTSNLGSGPNQTPLKVIAQPSGKIIIGGYFTSFNGATANRVIRLNADGTRDTAFMANTAGGANDYVASLLVKPDGKIVIGGTFTTFSGVSAKRIIQIGGGVASS